MAKNCMVSWALSLIQVCEFNVPRRPFAIFTSWKLYMPFMAKVCDISAALNMGDFVNFENDFACWDNFGNYHSESLTQNLGNLQRKRLWQSFFIVKAFSLQFTVIVLIILKLTILWNFILEIYLIFWSFLSLDCSRCILINASPNLLHSN